MTLLLLDFFTEGSNFMLKVHHDRGGREYNSDVDESIVESNAPVWATAKTNVALRVLVCKTFRIEPALGSKLFRFGVNGRIVERVKERRNDHTASRDNVVVGDWERFCSPVRDLHKIS
jgi:hypothetical protein